MLTYVCNEREEHKSKGNVMIEFNLDALFEAPKRPTPEDDFNIQGVTKCRVILMNRGVVVNEKIFNHRAYYMMKRFRSFWENPNRERSYILVETGPGSDADGAHWWLCPFNQDRCIKCYDIIEDGEYQND